MNDLLEFFWPCFAIGLVIGAINGTMVLRRRLGGMKRWRWIGAAAGIAIALCALWSGPLGAADRFTRDVEHFSRLVLDNNEMFQVDGRLGRGPLTRKMFLSGPADDFQRGELRMIMGNVPGVSTATWSTTARSLPMIVEAALVALAGMLIGWGLAGLLEWHRRYNAQWNW